MVFFWAGLHTGTCIPFHLSTSNKKYTYEIEIDIDLCANLYPSIDKDVKAFRRCNRFLAFLSFLTQANAPLSYAAPMDIEGFACDAFQMKEAALKCKEGRSSAGG